MTPLTVVHMIEGCCGASFDNTCYLWCYCTCYCSTTSRMQPTLADRRQHVDNHRRSFPRTPHRPACHFWCHCIYYCSTTSHLRPTSADYRQHAHTISVPPHGRYAPPPLLSPTRHWIAIPHHYTITAPAQHTINAPPLHQRSTPTQHQHSTGS